MACDICGKTGTRLNDLLSCYRSPGIVDICESCESAVNKRLWALRAISQRWMQRRLRRYMRQRAGKAAKPRNKTLFRLAASGAIGLILACLTYF